MKSKQSTCSDRRVRPRRHAPGFALKALPLAAALCCAPALYAQVTITGAAGLPQGGTVAAGDVTGGVSGNKMTLTQTGNRAVIDWQSFNINAGKEVQFVQPSASAAVLNRVSASAGMSEIYGTLSANGTVLLANPNGVLFGAGGAVNVASLIVTTGTVHQAEFLAEGGFSISGASTGSVVNEGSITASDAGLVALVAPSVSNRHRIIATGGRIALSGADRATISFTGGLYGFVVPGGALGTNAMVSNTAAARLEGATILLSTGDAANLVSGVINLEGVQQASSAMVINGDTVVLKSALDAPAVSGASNTIQVHAGARIQDGVKIAKTGVPGAGATVQVQAGTFTEQVILDKANLTLSGVSGAKLVVPDAAQVNGIEIRANNVSVDGLEIAGPVDASYLTYAWGSNISRGIAVSDGITGFAIRNNDIHDVRNGILIHGRNSTGTVSNNRIENTKSGISVQYTDASGISITGNTQGSYGNEWGLNLHLNGHIVGGNIVSNSTPIAAAPDAAWQQSLLALSIANGGWSVQDQAYTSSNRTHAAVATTGSPSNQGSLINPLNTVAGGINAVVSGGTVNVAAGTYTQSSTLNVSKSVTLAGAGQGDTFIDARSVNSYGMQVSADNVTLRDFTLYGPAANFASAYGIKVSPGSSNASARLRDLTIARVSSRGAGKAELDLNGVDGALIDQVTLNGALVGNDSSTSAGAGLQLTDSANITVRNSRTLNNAWGGLAIYQANNYYNQQVSGIQIEANNQFTESNPVYMQRHAAALHDFDALSIDGFGYAVRNSALNGYTWLQVGKQQAYDFAVNVPDASTNVSTVQTWSGAAAAPDFQVGAGNLSGGGTRAMSIGAAISQSASGAGIAVDTGSYNESINLNSQRDLRFSGATLQGLTLQAGAANSGIGGQVTVTGAGGFTADAALRLLSDTTLSTTGGNISLTGQVSNDGSTPRALSLLAGSGSVRGDVSMASGGAVGNPLGQLQVRARNYNLGNTLRVRSYSIDALTNVALSNTTLIGSDAAASNQVTAGGNVTGTLQGPGAVALQSGGNMAVNVTGSQVNLQAGGQLTALVNASTLSVRAVQAVDISGSASNVSVDAPSGSLNGTFPTVNNTGKGVLTINGRPEVNQEVKKVEPARIIPVVVPPTPVFQAAPPPPPPPPPAPVQAPPPPPAQSSDQPADQPSGQPPAGRPAASRVAQAPGPAPVAPVVVSTAPKAGGAVMDKGQAVELDLSPGRNNSNQK